MSSKSDSYDLIVTLISMMNVVDTWSTIDPNYKGSLKYFELLISELQRVYYRTSKSDTTLIS